MRILVAILLISSLVACQKDSFLEEMGGTAVGNATVSTDLTDDEIFDELDLQQPRASLDNSTQGLYRGVFSTYDGFDHGEILINYGNDGDLAAAIHFIDGSKLAFTSDSQDINSASFRSANASFTFSVTDIADPMVSQVFLDSRAGYIKVYKELSNRRVSVALGRYQDNQDPVFKGNWDLISFGVPEFNFPGAYSMDEIILSRGEQLIVDTQADTPESFSGCFGFDVRGPYMAQIAGDIGLLEAKNQIADFNGQRCDWSISFSFQDGRGLYSNTRCEAGANSGVWAWNARSGKLYVDALRINQ